MNNFYKIKSRIINGNFINKIDYLQKIKEMYLENLIIVQNFNNNKHDYLKNLKEIVHKVQIFLRIIIKIFKETP